MYLTFEELIIIKTLIKNEVMEEQRNLSPQEKRHHILGSDIIHRLEELTDFYTLDEANNEMVKDYVVLDSER